MSNPLKIEKIVSRVLGIGPRRWRWRTCSTHNGQIGVWSEHYNSEDACDWSIEQHCAFLGDAKIEVVGS